MCIRDSMGAAVTRVLTLKDRFKIGREDKKTAGAADDTSTPN